MLPSMLLKEARQRAGLTQDELGERTGHSGDEVSRWERGKVALSFERLEDLIGGCGLEFDIALRPADRSQYPLMRGNVDRSPEQRLNGLRRHLKRSAAIQNREESFDPQRLLSALAAREVTCVVIGGVAAVLWGSPFPTDNLDIMLREGVRNHQRFERALATLKAKRENTDEGIEAYSTTAGSLRVIRQPVALPSFRTLRRHAEIMPIGKGEIPIAPLAEVIRSAEARPKQGRRAELLALRRLATEIVPEAERRQQALLISLAGVAEPSKERAGR